MAGFGGAMLLSGCKDYLTERSTTKPSFTDVYLSVEAAKTAMTGLYGQMSAYAYYGNQVFYVFNLSGGFITIGIDPSTSGQADASDCAKYRYIPSNSLISQAWNPIYRNINCCNDSHN